jgi:hypothetical protein
VRDQPIDAMLTGKTLSNSRREDRNIDRPMGGSYTPARKFVLSLASRSWAALK